MSEHVSRHMSEHVSEHVSEHASRHVTSSGRHARAARGRARDRTGQAWRSSAWVAWRRAGEAGTLASSTGWSSGTRTPLEPTVP